MSRFVVASHFDDGERYFSGLFRLGQHGWNSLEPVAVPDRERGWIITERDAADSIATGLTELARAIPPRDARTWFVRELPEVRP